MRGARQSRRSGHATRFEHMLAVSQVKLAWVDELPVFLWQVQSCAIARAFLGMFDTPRKEPHRVSLRFGTGELRQGMESWAGGGAQSQRLRLELLSPQWCKLDDTWAETSHRDVMRLTKRVAFSAQSWMSATLRLEQNMGLWGELNADARARFGSMFYR